MRASSRRHFALALAIVGSTACSSAAGRTETGSPSPGSTRPAVAAATLPGADAFKAKWNEADVHFMSGMIPHHAQAVSMCKLAPTNGASEPVRILCERIIVGQSDEIALMQSWLHDRGEKVPPADATHLRMTMDGMEHDMLMPGMMTPEEMAQLKAARGREFDRLWLMGMIRHHEGAITMVEQLFSVNGAGQDEVVFRFASDVFADQTTEIERMQRMLEALSSGGNRL